MSYNKNIKYDDLRKIVIGIIVMAVVYDKENKPISADLIPIWWNLPENIELAEEVEITDKTWVDDWSLVVIKKIHWDIGSKAYHAACIFCDKFLKQQDCSPLEDILRYHELQFVFWATPMKFLSA